MTLYTFVKKALDKNTNRSINLFQSYVLYNYSVGTYFLIKSVIQLEFIIINYSIDKITSVFTTFGQSCAVLLYLKTSDYCDGLAMLFANYSFKLSNFYFDNST